MATINSFYHEHAMEYAIISEDGLVVTLPSEKKTGVCYEVRCEHTAHGVEAVDCQCWGFRRWGHCKHLTIVNDSKNPRITEVETGTWYVVNRNTQVWFDAELDQWFAVGPTENALQIVLAHIEAHQAVAEAERLVSCPNGCPQVDEVSVVENISQQDNASKGSDTLNKIETVGPDTEKVAIRTEGDIIAAMTPEELQSYESACEERREEMNAFYSGWTERLNAAKKPAIQAPKFDPNKALFGNQNCAFSLMR